MDKRTAYQYDSITIAEVPHMGRVTKKYEVYSNALIPSTLGTIYWFDTWKRFSFFPATYQQTVFDAKCLDEIALFLNTETLKHAQKLKKAGN